MPFTLSHAAAVLPAVRGDGTGRARLVPAMLLAGSFAPDMTYYAANVLPGAMEFGEVTHSVPGVFSVDAATAWASAWLWLAVREPLVALLPRARQGRPAALLRCGAPPSRVTASLVLRWYVSAVLGALTHVVWDAFTHPGRWGVRLFPVLGHEAAGAPLYWCLQYGSSAAAAVVIVWFMVRALRRAPAAGAPGVPLLSVRDRWWAGAVIAGCAAAGAAQRVSESWTGPGGTLLDLVPAVCFGTGAGLAVGVVAYATGLRALRARREPERDAGTPTRALAGPTPGGGRDARGA
ncbi:DUF4184 family protein [Streptomyces sp. NPDC046985]|uniref:DUF4184 family protein n=1 Tax=Streptomyces sp. NPDC046985 TaxID=3155377 RepID=UPI0033FF52CA